MKYFSKIRYTCWFHPDFPYALAEHDHMAWDERLEEYVAELTEDIRRRGTQNPVVVTHKSGRTLLHPGKCRVRALKNLGIPTVDAIVVHYGLPGFQYDKIPAGCTAITSQEQLNSYLAEDCVGEMTHRFCTVKKKR